MASVGSILEQPQGGERNDGRGTTKTIVKKGDYDALAAEAATLDVAGDGEESEGKEGEGEESEGEEGEGSSSDVLSWSLERAPGGLGVLTIVKADNADNDSEEDDDNVISEKWSVKNVQQQLPLSRFYIDGTWSLGSAPDEHGIALWRQEPRKELYDAYKFLAPDGNVYELSQSSKKVADKYKKGIECVMRFYPVVTRTTTYKRGMNDTKIGALGIGAFLAHIQTPAKTFGLTPGTWLCIQDEVEVAANGTLVRTTGWMGCKTLDSDLYGDSNRWEPMN